MPRANKLTLAAALLCAAMLTTAAAAPAPPAKLAATAPLETVVCLSWTGSAARYNVYRGTSPGAESLLKSVNAPFFTDFTGADGATFFYKVTAIDAAGESAPSNEASATTKPPVTTRLNADPGDGQIFLKWAECKSAIGYKVYRASLYDAATFLTTTPSLSDTTVVAGRTCYYQVAPIGVSGEQPQPGPQVAATARGESRAVALSEKAPPEPEEPRPIPNTEEAAPKPFRGSITATLPGEETQTYEVLIPDLNKPVRAAFIYSMVGIDQPRLTALARSFNAAIIGFGPFLFQGQSHTTPDDTSHPILTLDYRWPRESARRVQAVLARLSAQFAHPEIQYAGVVFYGFSEGTDNTGLVAAQPQFIHRLLAIVQLHEIGEDRYNPITQMLAAPHLFLSSFGHDVASPLLDGMEELPSVTHDAYARALVTNQGAPLTLVNHVGQMHGGEPDAPFISQWLHSVLSRRLPTTPSTTSPLTLPNCRNAPGWLGTYDVVKDTHTPPWGDEQRLQNVLIAPRSEYRDPRPYIWLPDQQTAEVWKHYSTSGVMP